MKISMENPDKVSGLLTIVVEENDYKSKVEQKLKEYRRKANVPGFRPGQVPMGFIKRQYGELIQSEVEIEGVRLVGIRNLHLVGF